MNLWASTSYFNPARHRQRLRDFRVFRSRLRAPLIAVEPSDAEIPGRKMVEDALHCRRSNPFDGVPPA